MSMNVKEVTDWLKQFDPEDSVGIDEGGLTLVIEEKPGAYLEVGGISETCETKGDCDDAE